MTVQAGLCQTCSETTLLVFPRGGSNILLIIADPVENIKLEIKGVANAMSMGPIVGGDNPVEMRPGQYEVC